MSALLLALLGACSDTPGSASGAEPAGAQLAGSAQAEANAPPPARDDLPAMLEYKAKTYAKGLIADDPPMLGELEEGERRDLLAVLKGGYCYRVLGVGGSEVADMDLFLMDPDGMQTHQDPGEDPYPVLGVQADICPPYAGSYRIQVYMYKGGGPFAVRVYRTPQ